MKELSYLETIKMIAEIKKCFESQLEARLGLIKVQSPIFLKVSSGLQDGLTGIEKAVSFKKGEEEFEVVHSLAKWKREALGKYEFTMHTGIYTDTKAIRKDEIVDEIHSLFVEQWDWEKVISKEDRDIEYLKDTVRTIYKCIRQTLIYMKDKYHFIDCTMPKKITFITSQELEDMYPDISPSEREQVYGKENGAIFIIGIGDKLASGKVHDKRSPDYDDWSLDGDLLIYDKAIDRTIEISSMGIRVDENSIKEQLEKSKCIEKIELPYHQKILKKELPYTIGGGIGESRLIMLILGKIHIAEVQASAWETKTCLEFEKMKVL